MTHWGWYWRVKKRHESKLLCSYFYCIDSFKIFKQQIQEFSLDSGNVHARYLEGNFKVEFVDGPRKGKFYELPVEQQPCYFGGYRYFFRCPICSKRMRKLYDYFGFLLCRKCLKVGYYSQRLTPSSRYSMMKRRIEDALSEKGGGIFDKPKWMRKQTFNRLTSRYWDYEYKEEKAVLIELKDVLGIDLLRNF